ncbi:hypothetical protein N0V93_005495 [Gnomoniopsis smithogilvyi]|uniref:Uncharacterized protein n=1 Tax=Gnomoniopsis smithogilvyi TaxID=1191159 RepID=A0A9W8YUQ5_9PEZI|nr:hypothetical protein N0V93_005495 [Gnomoniopsis smithogilvyi]
MSDSAEHGDSSNVERKPRLILEDFSVNWEKFDVSDDPEVSDDPDAQQVIHSLLRTGLPEVLRHGSSTLLELFSDLFFVATLNVFTSAHEIVRATDLASYIEFEFLLWSTWFLVVIRDVRFLSDSWAERISMGLNLGIMIAFSEIAPFFSALEEIDGVAVSMSLTLMVSRIFLTCQYGLTSWHLRYYLDARKSMMTLFALHLVAACLYALITAACASSADSGAHQLLILVSSLEILLNIVVAMKPDFRIISFEGTHLAERLNLLTLIILGEGIIELAKDVALIEHNLGWQPWSARMWMVFTCGVAVIYIIFQVYFDWMHPNDMASRRKLVWALVHAPFHFTLLLVMEAVNQLIVWWRIMEILKQNSADIFSALGSRQSPADAAPTSEEVARRLNETATDILDRFIASENMREIMDNVMGRLNDIAQLPDEVFQTAFRLNLTDASLDSDMPQLGDGANSSGLRLLISKLGQLLGLLTNVVFSSFDLEVFEDGDGDLGYEETQTFVSEAFDLVFAYSFVATGLMLLFLTVLHAVSKRHGWTVFNLVRSAVVISIGIGLGLVPIAIQTGPLTSPLWALPVICASLIIVLFITHVPHPRITVREDIPNDQQG